MSKFLLAAALAGVASAAPLVNVHPDRLAQIADIKSKTSQWVAAPQLRFAEHAPGASKPLCGVFENNTEVVKAALASGEVVEFVPKNLDAPIPDAFDSAVAWPACAKVINDIRDQSNCGCCWAFAGAEAASDRMCIATKAQLLVPLSAQDVCFCASMDGCQGGQITTPWSHIHEGLFGGGGAVSGGQFNGTGPFGKQCSDFSLPHCHHHGPQGSDPYPAEGQPGCESQKSAQCPTACGAGFPDPFKQDKYSFKGSTQTARGEASIQQMIMEAGPVETAFTVYSDFENYNGGIYHHVSGSAAGGHAVKFVGWGVDGGVKYWKVANSWNPYWGEKGFFRIQRGNNEGGIENSVTGSPTGAAWSKKAGN